MSQEEIKELRRQLSARRKELKALQSEFLERLDAARAALAPDAAQALVLEVERERLAAELDDHATTRRQQVNAAVENWWDKYCVSLEEIQAKRDVALDQLEEFIRELGYVHE